MSRARGHSCTALLCMLAFFLGCSLAWSAPPVPLYTITDLGNGSNPIIAKDSALVVVVDRTSISDANFITIVYPTHDVLNPYRHSYGLAFGANNNRIVGRLTSWTLTSAVVWDPEHGLRYLDSTNIEYSSATGIANDIVGLGKFLGSGNTEVPLLWVDGTSLLELPTLGGEGGAAYGINEAGWAVGNSKTTSGQSHATLWKPTGEVVDLHYPGIAGSSSASDINLYGAVIGSISYPGGQLGFLWLEYWGMLFLLPLTGQTQASARSLNDSGDIVGQSFVPVCSSCPPTAKAVLWWYNTPPVDLNTRLVSGTGWVLESATGINNAGQIVGEGTLNGQPRSFLLTPQIPPSPWRPR